ncbi:hypothetical protein JNB_16003 [Janibacter sp. HTCC2649]|nr:hypothetical protein JNB_16003 [Janibacter sp. HTCC2649]
MVGSSPTDLVLDAAQTSLMLSESTTDLERCALRDVGSVVSTGPHRLAAQDSALSRRQHGFESRWGYAVK